MGIVGLFRSIAGHEAVIRSCLHRRKDEQWQEKAAQASGDRSRGKNLGTSSSNESECNDSNINDQATLEQSIKEESLEYQKVLQDKTSELVQKRAALKREIFELSTREGELKVAIEETKEAVRRASAMSEMNRLGGHKSKLLQRRRYQLYRYITGIQWDNAVENQIKGFVSLDRVSAFDFSHLSPGPLLADALWKKIESCVV